MFFEYTNYYTGITTIISTEPVAKLLAMVFIAQLAEHCTKFAGPRVRLPAEGSRVEFYAAGHSLVLKCNILRLENFLHHK